MRIKSQNRTLTIRTNDKSIKQLNRICKKMKVSQRVAIEIALSELEDLLRDYPQVDYNPELGGWLLRRMPIKEIKAHELMDKEEDDE